MEECKECQVQAKERIRGFEVVRDDCRKFPNQEIIMPRRMTEHAMAYDVFANEEATILPGGNYEFKLDIKAYMPEDEGAIMNVRSSMGFKRKLKLINTQGWIDSDFYGNEDNDGNIGVNLFNFGDKAQTIEKGERIAQIMFIMFNVTDNDDEQQKEIRVGGTGSTGTK